MQLWTQPEQLKSNLETLQCHIPVSFLKLVWRTFAPNRSVTQTKTSVYTTIYPFNFYTRKSKWSDLWDFYDSTQHFVAQEVYNLLYKMGNAFLPVNQKINMIWIQAWHICWPAWYTTVFWGSYMKTPHPRKVLKKRLVQATAYVKSCTKSST